MSAPSPRKRRATVVYSSDDNDNDDLRPVRKRARAAPKKPPTTTTFGVLSPRSAAAAESAAAGARVALRRAERKRLRPTVIVSSSSSGSSSDDDDSSGIDDDDDDDTNYEDRFARASYVYNERMDSLAREVTPPSDFLDRLQRVFGSDGDDDDDNGNGSGADGVCVPPPASTSNRLFPVLLPGAMYSADIDAAYTNLLQKPPRCDGGGGVLWTAEDGKTWTPLEWMLRLRVAQPKARVLLTCDLLANAEYMHEKLGTPVTDRAMVLATEIRQLAVLTYMLNQGGNVNATDADSGKDLLCIAVERNDRALVKLLLHYGSVATDETLAAAVRLANGASMALVQQLPYAQVGTALQMAQKCSGAARVSVALCNRLAEGLDLDADPLV